MKQNASHHIAPTQRNASIGLHKGVLFLMLAIAVSSAWAWHRLPDDRKTAEQQKKERIVLKHADNLRFD